VNTDENLNGGLPLDDQQRQMLAHLERGAGGPEAGSPTAHREAETAKAHRG